MKYLKFIPLLLLFACEEDCYECRTYRIPYSEPIKVEQVTKWEAEALDGQRGTMTSRRGEEFSYVIICDKK